jgi:hypothetical protein
MQMLMLMQHNRPCLTVLRTSYAEKRLSLYLSRWLIVYHRGAWVLGICIKLGLGEESTGRH